VGDRSLNFFTFEPFQQILLNTIDDDWLLLNQLTIGLLIGYISGRCGLSETSLQFIVGRIDYPLVLVSLGEGLLI
jgi:hypothetical protein